MIYLFFFYKKMSIFICDCSCKGAGAVLTTRAHLLHFSLPLLFCLVVRVASFALAGRLLSHLSQTDGGRSWPTSSSEPL